MKKPRDIWLHNHDKFGWEVHFKEPQIYHHLVREVDPAKDELFNKMKLFILRSACRCLELDEYACTRCGIIADLETLKERNETHR